MLKFRAFVCGVVVLLAGSALAGDVSGKWVAQTPGRDGQMRETTYTFKVEGEKLTGTLSGMMGETPIADGKVKGDEISFSVKMSMRGNEMTMLYKGKLSGEELKLTRTREGGQGQPQEFTAKRAK